jgi:hypothetical protein
MSDIMTEPKVDFEHYIEAAIQLVEEFRDERHTETSRMMHEKADKPQDFDPTHHAHLHRMRIASDNFLAALSRQYWLSRRKNKPWSKPRRKTPPLKLKPFSESDDAGISRFVRLAFRRAVEKTGKVVVVKMERRWLRACTHKRATSMSPIIWCKNRHRAHTSPCRWNDHGGRWSGWVIAVEAKGALPLLLCSYVGAMLPPAWPRRFDPSSSADTGTAGWARIAGSPFAEPIAMVAERVLRESGVAVPKFGRTQ